MLSLVHFLFLVLFFFFNDTATTEIYTLSLHDALPISLAARAVRLDAHHPAHRGPRRRHRKRSEGTRLNSSHLVISYAVFCVKKKKYGTSTLRRSAALTLIAELVAGGARV